MGGSRHRHRIAQLLSWTPLLLVVLTASLPGCFAGVLVAHPETRHG